MEVQAVIGSGFGDEGKGMLTDYFSDPETLVVRSNGGANAAHTVCRDGNRHVFHHFGSGSLRGASTFLSRFFVNNPILFFKELDVLKNFGCEPSVTADWRGLVTTPWDMMINQIVEETRGVTRHGSCGVGINETMQRHTDFPFTVIDMDDPDEICRSIMTTWVPRRLEQLSILPSDEWLQRLTSMEIFAHYIEQCDAYRASISIDADDMIHQGFERIIFEGAQGLLLDQDHPFFPHVTHSKTGLPNILKICQENGLPEPEVVYVTRAYATRHGAGPFPGEQAGLTYEDATNQPNDWQGTLRFGYLDLDLISSAIRRDMAHREPFTPGLAVTCLDQVGDSVKFWADDALCQAKPIEMIERFAARIGAKNVFCGHGPDASSIREIKM